MGQQDAFGQPRCPGGKIKPGIVCNIDNRWQAAQDSCSSAASPAHVRQRSKMIIPAFVVSVISYSPDACFSTVTVTPPPFSNFSSISFL